MIKRHVLTEEQILYVIENGEFGEDVLSNGNVVVIMTQDWCPQWTHMQSWIYDLAADDTVDIYELIYNKINNFSDFVYFKENSFGNHEIPYLRYYRNGKLINETNYINMTGFKSIVGI
jgi:hypothetical protein